MEFLSKQLAGKLPQKWIPMQLSTANPGAHSHVYILLYSDSVQLFILHFNIFGESYIQ